MRAKMQVPWTLIALALLSTPLPALRNADFRMRDQSTRFSIFTFLLFSLNLAAALYLVVTRREERRLDRALSFTLSLGFALHTAMLASGSLYKFLLFGRAWSFDPIETLGFVAWVAYGTLLHMHLFAGWEGRRLAAWSLGLFLLLLVSYRGIVYFPAWSSYHILDMDLRMHLMSQAPGGPP